MEQRRKLGVFEDLLAPHRKVCNIIVPTQLTLKRPLNENLLQQATLIFIKSQPNLKAGLCKIDGELHFSPLQDINDFFEVLPLDYDWKKITLKYANTHIHEDFLRFSPLKVYLIPQSDQLVYIIPVYAHYAADGTNGMTIVNDILTIYSKLQKGEAVEMAHRPPPSLEDMVVAAIPAHKKDELSEKFVSKSRRDFSSYNFCFPFEDNPVTGALYYTSSPKTFDNFVITCRAQQSTVGTALTASMYFGLAGYIFNNIPECPDELVLGINLPVNLRNRTPKDISNNCCNLSVTQMLVSMKINRQKKFWNFAREVRQSVIEMMNEDQMTHMFDFSTHRIVSQCTERQDILDKFHVNIQSCVSNMRRYPRSSVDYEDFAIESIHCVGGIWLPKQDVMELMIYSTNKFNLSIIHRHGEKNIARAEKVFEYVKFIVENPESLDYELQDIIRVNEQ